MQNSCAERDDPLACRAKRTSQVITLTHSHSLRPALLLDHHSSCYPRATPQIVGLVSDWPCCNARIIISDQADEMIRELAGMNSSAQITTTMTTTAESFHTHTHTHTHTHAYKSGRQTKVLKSQSARSPPPWSRFEDDPRPNRWQRCRAATCRARMMTTITIRAPTTTTTR